jgi:hypothetical protein
LGITGTPVPMPIPPQPEQPALLIAPFEKDEAKAKWAAWAQYRQIDAERKNSLDMELVLIRPAGFRWEPRDGRRTDEGLFLRRERLVCR